MKKKTIWTIAIIMGFSFLALLYLQLSYIQEMVNMKKEQFDESVNRALYQASRNLELNETLRYLEKNVNETERKANKDKNKGTAVYSTFELKTNATHPGNMPKAMILRSDKKSLTETQKSLQEIVKSKRVYCCPEHYCIGEKCNYEMSVISGRTNPPASFQKYSVVLLDGNLPCHNTFDSLNAYDIVSGSIHTAFVASESSGHDSVGAVDLCI